MKKLLILFLFFSSSLVGDDIKEYSIEGISIGDSLLNYMSEKEILREFELGKNEYEWTDQKFTDVYIYDNLETYEYFSASVKRNDKKYIVYSMRGMIDFNDINKCLNKKKQIIEELSSFLNYNNKFEDIFKHPGDKTGNSTVYGHYFVFDYGDEMEVTCYDFSSNVSDNSGLDVAINSKEFIDWLTSW